MFSIASNLRLALTGLALVTAAALPSVVHADGLPNPVPRKIPGAYPPPVLRLADLVVDSPSYQRRSGLYVPTLAVRNTGNGEAGPFVVDVNVSVIPAGGDLPSGRPMYDRRPIANLFQGGTIRISLDGIAARRGDTILVEGVVDATYRVGEWNERNNRFSLRIPVL